MNDPAERESRAPVLRPERPDDQALLFDLFRDAHGGALVGLDPALADTLLRRQWAGQATSYCAAFPAARFDVVEVDGWPVGRVLTAAAADHLRLVDVALLPEWRGRGLGTALVRSLQDEARAADVPLRLSVVASNAGARRLYDRLGFASEGSDGVAVAMRWPAQGPSSSHTRPRWTRLRVRAHDATRSGR